MPEMTIQQAMDMAMAHHRAGRMVEAEPLYRWVLSVQPDHSDAWHLLGLMAVQLNQPAPGVDLASRAVAIKPGIAGYRDTLGRALAGADRIDEAIGEFRQALTLDPNHAQVHLNLGTTLMRVDRFEEALGHLQFAATALPGSALAQNNLGNCLAELGDIERAVAVYRDALKASPDEPTIHYNLGTSLLMTGNLPEGFVEYEWRWKVPALGLVKPPFTQPVWDGSDLHGKTLLLHAEQGYGDAIQFIRYAPMLARRGARVLFGGPTPIARLMKTVEGIDRVLDPDEVPSGFDVHCPLLHLPLLMKTTLDTIPRDVPYIHPDPQQVESFRQRMGPERALNIGLVWAGRPEHLNDRHRSIPLDQLAPLAQVPDARFHSLQLGPAAQQAKSLPPGLDLTDWTAELHDFTDTAALMAALDVIISVDTAPAHLAGALGRPLFILLPFRPDWRWMLHRSDSPWYPSAQLFRQPKRGDWTTPMAAMVEALRGWKRN